MTREKYEAYCDVYSFLHYEYNATGKTKEQVIKDIKAYCLKKSGGKEMNIEHIYNSVEKFIKKKYGTKRWCYTDFFLDEKGKKYFIEQIETDNEILPDWNDEEIIEHICNSISSSMFLYDMQQEMLYP